MKETADNIELSIVVPFYREGENVKLVLEELLHIMGKIKIHHEIIVVNNGADRETAAYIGRFMERHSQIVCVSIRKNTGLGSGLRSGFAVARGRYICFFGGDRQTNPRDLIRMIAYARVHREVDMLSGNRIIRNDSLYRLILSRVFNKWFQILFKTELQDINGTPKLFTRQLLNRMSLDSDNWFIDCELVLKALCLHMTIVNFPVEFRKRVIGKSHINITAVFEFIIKLLWNYIKKK